VIYSSNTQFMLHWLRSELYHIHTKGFNLSDREQCLPSPITTFGFILATLFGAVFHLIMGGDARRLALFLLAGWVGFGLGHLLGVALGINILNIGTLRIFTASVGAFIALFVAHFLTSNRAHNQSTG
jgi:uncharacterized membrane protein YeaQ/YmgE (transglycosylase-associated protein family)